MRRTARSRVTGSREANALRPSCIAHPVGADSLALRGVRMNEKERLASEAARLLNEPLLVEALDGIMADAFAEFKALRVSQETLPDVIALQQRILVAHEIHDRINAKILASGQADGGVTVETKPTA
jgi:hypothetical protein